MDWAEELQRKYEEEFRACPGYGKNFSLASDESDPYWCETVGRIEFGEGNIREFSGNTVNHQEIFLDGVVVGTLREITYYNIFKPMIIMFYIPLDDDEVTEEIRQHPNFVQEEWCNLEFATLQQLIDYVKEMRCVQ